MFVRRQVDVLVGFLGGQILQEVIADQAFGRLVPAPFLFRDVDDTSNLHPRKQENRQESARQENARRTPSNDCV